MIPTMSSNAFFSAPWPCNSHHIRRPPCYHLTITQSSINFCGSNVYLRPDLVHITSCPTRLVAWKRQFRGKKWQDISLLCGIEPGHLRWKLAVLTTMPLGISFFVYSYHYSPGLTLDTLLFPAAAQDIFPCPIKP